ncbi:MAG: glycosyltransferase family 2 protein [Deltaproteobacteria bacterium]
MLQASILITSYQRPNLLKWNLFSLARQRIPFSYEVIVLNDGTPDATEELCKSYKSRLPLKYVFTGQRNLKGDLKYRVPGFAVNIGAQLSKGKVLIISCAEMYHINDTIAQLVPPVLMDNKTLATSIGMDDQDASFLEYVDSNGGDYDEEAYLCNYPCLNTTLPFLMAMKRSEFFSIGGYDEDFTGYSYDDNDLMSRLEKNGCSLCLTQAQTIHLYHHRHSSDEWCSPDTIYNANLFRERADRVIRNLGRNWGQVEKI